jgi:tetratricopeptide (TPR) repeat protein
MSLAHQRGECPEISAPQPNPGAAFAPRDWLVAAALIGATFLVYQPVWRGGFIWDDDGHVTRSELRSCQGLYRIWFDVHATHQYYPLLHSVFWIEHRLWGDAPLGYHLVNILLHGLAAVLVFQVLRRLQIPGAMLAAAIFAVHPVQVESVAWITEQKNTLSAVFYLGAMLSYLRFDRARRKTCYALASTLFALGLLSKTVTATLPATLLVIFWWQRGRLSWKRDVLPLGPWLALGAAAGLFTAWWERALAGAAGAAYAFSPLERVLIAGRALWFYLAKLLWPADLIFIYPRWRVSQAVAWQYLFPLTALAALLALWLLRGRTRAPLAAALCYVGTLFPVLGFFNVYPFRYSLVADHFQYLASVAVIAAFTAGVASCCGRGGRPRRLAGHALGVSLLALLALLSWRQSRTYADLETLYQTTLDRNPDCWMALANLGKLLADRGEFDAAMADYRKALQVNSAYAEAHNNLGNLLFGRGDVDGAIDHYRQALESKPQFAEAHDNLALALAGHGQVDEALVHYRRALEISPDFVGAYNDLGMALTGRRQFGAAIANFQKALEIQPDYAEAHNNLGIALTGRGEVDAAMLHYFKAIGLKPAYAEAHNNLGTALAGHGQFDEAIDHYRQALRIQPGNAGTSRNLAALVAARDRITELLAQRRQSLRSRPDDAALLNDIAWRLATSPCVSLRNGAEAVELARRAIAIGGDREPALQDTLAAAYAETGRFSEAVETSRRGAALADRAGNAALADRIRARLIVYQSRAAYRDLQ